MFIKKRIIPLLLVLALLPTFMSVPASAADLSGDENSTCNFLASTTYNMYRNGLLQAKGLDYPNRHVSDSSKNLSFEWTPSASYNTYDRMYFTIRAEKQPDKVEFQPYSSRVFIAEFIGQSGRFYQYRVNAGSDLGAITIRAHWNSGYAGSFGIVSCVGFFNGLTSSVSNVDIFGRETFFGSHGTYVASETATIINSDNWSLPNLIHYNSLRHVDYSFNSIFYLTVDPDDHGCDYLDYIEFNFSAVDVSLITASIVDKNNTPIQSVDVSVAKGTWKTVVMDGGNEFWLYHYTARADLGGMDLSQYSLQLAITVEHHFSTDDVALYFLDVGSVVYRQYVEELPWYQVFYRWINKSITKTGDSIVSAINNLAGVFGENGQLQQAGEAMSNQASSMQAANNQLDSVEKPSVDTGQLLDNFLSFNTGGMTILSSLTNNSFVPQLMVVVFTFALCGYIFFGKKG